MADEKTSIEDLIADKMLSINEQTPARRFLTMIALMAVLHRAANIMAEKKEAGPRYFGDPWPSVFCMHAPSAPAPLLSKCAWCDEGFIFGEQGVLLPHVGEDGAVVEIAYHKNCFLRTIFGSVGHIQGKCSCQGGTEEDPTGLSKRQAADAAVAEWDRRHFPPTDSEQETSTTA